MKITCDNCGKEYNIDESKIPGKKAKVTCKVCNSYIFVTKPEEPDFSFFDDTLLESGQNETDASNFEDSLKKDSLKSDTQTVEEITVPGFSIRSKITLAITLLVVISLGSVGFLASFKSKEALSSQMELQMTDYADQKAKEYGLIFERIQEEAAAIADYAGMIYDQKGQKEDLGSKILMPWNGEEYSLDIITDEHRQEMLLLQRIGMILETMASKNPYISIGYMGTESGFAFFDKDTIEIIGKMNGFIVFKREWYKKAKAEGKVTWTNPYVDANTKELVVTCAIPVHKSDGTFVGVIGLDILLNTIQNDILKIDVGYDSYAFLLDDQGKALVRPGMTTKDARWDTTYKTDDLTKTENTEFNEIINEMIKGGNDLKIYTDNSKEKYISYAGINSIGASLGIVVSKDQVIKPATDIQLSILIIVLIVLVLSILIGFILGNNIIRPLNRLTKVANLISQGKMELEVIDENRKDEIGLLTKSINRLVTSLKLALE